MELLSSPPWRQPSHEAVFVIVAAVQVSVYSQVLLWVGGEYTIDFWLGLLMLSLLSAVSVNCWLQVHVGVEFSN